MVEGLPLGTVQSGTTGMQRWRNPCGSQPIGIPLPPPSTELSDKINKIKEIILHLREGITLFGRLKNDIGNQRIGATERILYLNGQHMAGLESEDNIDQSDVARVYLSSFQSISKAAIFLELVLDNKTYERAFLINIKNAERKLYTILCHEQMAIDQLGITIEEYASRDILPQYATPLPTIDRYERDYKIVKEIELTLQTILDRTEELKRRISGS